MEIKQHFVKNNDFKTVLGSGVFGGLTPAGQINMVVFTDRVPIPNLLTIEVDDKDGAVKGEIAREGKDGIIKEMQVGVIMDINTAKNTIAWLTNHVEQLEKLFSANKI